MWKLAVAAALIWLAVVLQHNLSDRHLPETVAPSPQPTPAAALPAQSRPTPATASPAPPWPVITPTVTPLPTEPPATPALTPTPAPTTHTVRPGETLLSIAAHYSTTANAILIANNLANSQTLQVGQKLVIPPAPNIPAGVKTVIHQIQPGNTLLELAGRYGSTVDDILAANPGLEPLALQVGQKILIPLTRSPATPAAEPASPGPAAPANLAEMEQGIIDAVNSRRQENGLAPLNADAQLSLVARDHARDMVARGYFDHVTLDGLTLRDRLKARGLVVNWAGENIQRNTEPAGESARAAVDWFMDSPPHRANILHLQFDRLGAGVAEGPPGWYTFVLVFAGNGRE